jgi:hypothetical protein
VYLKRGGLVKILGCEGVTSEIRILFLLSDFPGGQHSLRSDVPMHNFHLGWLRPKFKKLYLT